jgi:bifunctional non-homologous end joining protein LigD
VRRSRRWHHLVQPDPERIGHRQQRGARPFLFDLLHLDCEATASIPVTERKECLRALLLDVSSPLHFQQSPDRARASLLRSRLRPESGGNRLETVDAPHAPGHRGLWLKVKCLNREEFVVVGWTAPGGSCPYLGALLLADYDPDEKLIYAGRVGTGIDTAKLERLWRRLQPLATTRMPLDAPPRAAPDSACPSCSAAYRTLGAARAHCRGQVSRLDRDNLLRQVVYEGPREDKPPALEVKREVPRCL